MYVKINACRTSAEKLVVILLQLSPLQILVSSPGFSILRKECRDSYSHTLTLSKTSGRIPSVRGEEVPEGEFPGNSRKQSIISWYYWETSCHGEHPLPYSRKSDGFFRQCVPDWFGCNSVIPVCTSIFKSLIPMTRYTVQPDFYSCVKNLFLVDS
jgi:hypothetical protein